MNPNDLRKILKEELQPLISNQSSLAKTQDEMLKTQDNILNTQGRMQKTQDEMQQSQGNILKTLEEHGEKLDSITAELSQVHQLADVTVDIVSARYESSKREIDEIKDHLHLPKKPYFGKTP